MLIMRASARGWHVTSPEGTERDHQEAGAYPDLPLPFDERGQEREGQQHHQHRQQVTDGERPKRPQ